MILQPANCMTMELREQARFSLGGNTYPVENVLDCAGIIRFAVTLCALTFDADDLVWGVISILGVAFAEDFPCAVKETGGLGSRHNITLRPSLPTISSGVHITLTPGGDRNSPTCKDGVPASDTNRDRNVGQLDIVEDK